MLNKSLSEEPSNDNDDDDDKDNITNPSSLKDCFKVLSKEARELYLSEDIPELHKHCLTPLQFYRDWVSKNRPVIIRGAITDWPAFEKWQNNNYFRDMIGEKEITVTATPNGFADAAVGNKFVMPEERTMTVNDFLDIIENPSDYNGVFYAQKQNSSLTLEFAEIIQDIEEISWAREAFGREPDAVNFWMGDGRAVTSMHKDPYENIYCVVRGSKEVILQPPTDLPWIPYRDLSPAVYRENGDTGVFDVVDVEGDAVPWIVVDPAGPDLEQFPAYNNSTRMRFTVGAGDVLYLPSLWFHHLRQSHGCVSVNFWYDMDYDVKFNYFTLLNNLKRL